MTTIAWDGRTLVGDKMRGLEGHTTRCRKVFKIVCKHNGKTALIGCAGSSSDCIAVRDWFEDMSKPKPTVKEVSGLLVIKAIAGPESFWIDESLVLVPLAKGPFAIGSGSGYALGAMDAGKSAEEGVRIAAKRDRSTGLGVDVVSFK